MTDPSDTTDNNFSRTTTAVSGGLSEPTGGGTPARTRRRWLHAAVAVGVWAVGMATAFREVITSGLSVNQGSNWDHRLLVYLSEHWYHVVGGRASWRNPSMFHPVDIDLGYSDALALFGVFYLPARWVGADQFAAFQLAIMAVTTVGFASALWLFRRVLAARFGVAVLGAFLFAFASNLAVQFHHAQLLAAQFLPLVAVLVAESLTALGANRRAFAAGLAAAAGVVASLLMFTAFYIGWFGVLTTVVAALCVAVCNPQGTARALRWVRQRGTAMVGVIVAAAAGSAVGLIPFVATYRPVLAETDGRSFNEIMSLTPYVWNLLNLGPDNLVWGWVPRTLSPTVAQAVPSPSITPVLAVTTVVGVVAALVWRRGTPDMRRLRTAAGLVVASLVLGVAAIRVGDTSAWRVVYDLVPGAGAIRGPGRLPMVTSLMVVTAWVLVADVVWRQVRTLWGRGVWRSALVGVVVVVGVVTAAEQVQTGLRFSLDRDAELQWLASVPQPPAGCDWFVLVNPPVQYPNYASHIDAMLVSHKVGLPTINGYSGLFPPGWALIDPAAGGYNQAVADWVAANDLSRGGCRFDLERRQWDAGLPAGT